MGILGRKWDRRFPRDLVTTAAKEKGVRNFFVGYVGDSLDLRMRRVRPDLQEVVVWGYADTPILSLRFRR